MNLTLFQAYKWTEGSHAQIAPSGFQTVADDIYKVSETLVYSVVTKRKSGLTDCKDCTIGRGPCGVRCSYCPTRRTRRRPETLWGWCDSATTSCLSTACGQSSSAATGSDWRHCGVWRSCPPPHAAPHPPHPAQVRHPHLHHKLYLYSHKPSVHFQTNSELVLQCLQN